MSPYSWIFTHVVEAHRPGTAPRCGPTDGDLRVGEHRRRHEPVVGRAAARPGAGGCAATTLASWLATCLSWNGELASPSAKMPSTEVRCWSSTSTRPSRSASTPAFSRSSRSPLGMRPVATSRRSPAHGRAVDERQRDSRRVLPRGRDLHGRGARPSGRSASSREALGHRLVLVAQQQPAAADHRHPGAERGEHVRELGRDVPAADDHEPLGHVVDAHDRVRRVVRHVAERIGDPRAAAGRDHDAVGGELGLLARSISTAICFGPVNRAWPSYRVTFALRRAR